MIDYEKLKEGVMVRIKSADHWDINYDTCDGNDFSSGLESEMHQHFGCVGIITETNISKTYSMYHNVDIKFDNGYDYEFAWDLHSIAEIITKEENPEYYL